MSPRFRLAKLRMLTRFAKMLFQNGLCLKPSRATLTFMKWSSPPKCSIKFKRSHSSKWRHFSEKTTSIWNRTEPKPKSAKKREILHASNKVKILKRIYSITQKSLRFDSCKKKHVHFIIHLFAYTLQYSFII